MPAAAHLLRSWVRFPPGAWIFVCCECRVLSGRGLCDELITRPEESHRLCCVVVCDLETTRMGAPYIYIYIYIYKIYIYIYIYDISRLRAIIWLNTRINICTHCNVESKCQNVSVCIVMLVCVTWEEQLGIEFQFQWRHWESNPWSSDL